MYCSDVQIPVSSSISNELKSIVFVHVFASNEICNPSATFTSPCKPPIVTFFCVENHAYVDVTNIIAVNATSVISFLSGFLFS